MKDIQKILEMPFEHVLRIKDFTTQDPIRIGLTAYIIQQLLPDYEPKRTHKLFTSNLAEQTLISF